MEENRQIDLGGFTLYDSTPLAQSDNNKMEEAITQRMVENIYFAFQTAVAAKKQELNTLESLPEEEQIHDFEASKLYFRLPEVSILLPRAQRVPEQKPPTKW